MKDIYNILDKNKSTEEIYVIREGVTEISKAFVDCSKVTSIVIPNSVTSIEDGAFDYCSGLTSISVDPNNLNFSSLDGVLYDKEKTKIIKVPRGKTDDVVIPGSVISIAQHSFFRCTELNNIVIPISVTDIEDSAFNYCFVLTSISVDPNNLNFSSLDGVLYDKEKTKIIKVPCGKTGDFVIPNSVISIDHYSFCHCSKLTSIVIPNSVTDIGDYAFADCSKVTNIVIPDSVTSIGEGAFVNCEGLTSIVIPNSVTSIEYSAFKDCIKLNRFHCQIKNIKNVKIKTNIFKGCDLSNCILSVPTGADNDYKHHPVFSKFKNIVIEG